MDCMERDRLARSFESATMHAILAESALKKQVAKKHGEPEAGAEIEEFARLREISLKAEHARALAERGFDLQRIAWRTPSPFGLVRTQRSRSPQVRDDSRVRLSPACAEKPRSRSCRIWNHVEFIFDSDGNAVQCSERSARIPSERGLTCLRHKVLFVAG
jgi:hypothetical protein